MHRAVKIRRTGRCIDKARNHYFPGWWTYSRGVAKESNKPVYYVICQSAEEMALAQAAKPSNIRARFHYGQFSKSNKKIFTFHQILDKLNVSAEVLQQWIEYSLSHAVGADVFSLDDFQQLICCKVEEEAMKFFGKSSEWLDSPNPRFGGASPKQMMNWGYAEIVNEFIESLKRGMPS